jgi:hypothetical protein
MKRILALILVVILLLTGCSITDKLAENVIGGNSSGSEAGVTAESSCDDGDRAEDLDVVIVDTPPELIEFPNRSIGNASFKVETGISAKVTYTADGKGQSISVTDDSGIEWTLKIPENALLNEEEISITPLSSIEVDSFPGSDFHGILLKPDAWILLLVPKFTLKSRESQ